MDFFKTKSEEYKIGNPDTRDMSERAFGIEKQSFDIIESEIGNHDYTDDEWTVVRRVIHATADFDFACQLPSLSEKNVPPGRT